MKKDGKAENCRLLLFDLDGTLLRSDKTISPRTARALEKCRKRGVMLGICTSRARQNAMFFIKQLQPDVFIASGGAVAKYKDEYVCRLEFSREETGRVIAEARRICGDDCKITVDTMDAQYWSHGMDSDGQDKSWSKGIYTDFSDFEENALKICVDPSDEIQAGRLREALSEYDCVRFSDGGWYKFTRKEATKEHAIRKICAMCKIQLEEVIAFGDDYVDIGMLEVCGKGVAMGNAVEAVKEHADVVIGGNDEEGIAKYLEEMF
ncbi:MAG: Cof-type HAD-IIB family hydrolase [Ruminococcus sp.]|nr:Cof-type HAD-IIB family hydrolase [Ruminococcus sp.]